MCLNFVCPLFELNWKKKKLTLPNHSRPLWIADDFWSNIVCVCCGRRALINRIYTFVYRSRSILKRIKSFVWLTMVDTFFKSNYPNILLMIPLKHRAIHSTLPLCLTEHWLNGSGHYISLKVDHPCKKGGFTFNLNKGRYKIHCVCILHIVNVFYLILLFEVVGDI